MKKHTFFAIISFLFITSACTPRLSSTPTATQAKISIIGTSILPVMPTPFASSPTWTPPPVDVEFAKEYKSQAPDHLALWGVWGKTIWK